jgi:hypothetical protein
MLVLQLSILTVSTPLLHTGVLTLRTCQVYLIDVVRGSILQKVQHKGTAGGVHMVQSENWVAYHYRNRNMKRYEMGMLELFDASESDPSAPFTSRDATAPINVRQAYIFPHPATAMGLTHTNQGATETQVLVALPSGALMAIHKRTVRVFRQKFTLEDAALDPTHVRLKRTACDQWHFSRKSTPLTGYHCKLRPNTEGFLDARRPTNEKAAKHAGTLVAYHPILNIPAQQNINYNQTVLRTKQIHVGTTDLESTCLVRQHSVCCVDSVLPVCVYVCVCVCVCLPVFVGGVFSSSTVPFLTMPLLTAYLRCLPRGWICS